MVYIKKVEIYGFKSFGFTNKVINLEEGLVCITGPNGSGKSNILDAIAFALGENSPKTLRVDRLHSLLHDNANDSRSKRVRVSVTFDNTDRGIPIDSNTVTITREMPLDGDSIYLLNGKHVSKSTITDLLEVAFASPNKLNNVQQGMIMRIAELNAEERRRILEDIIGLSYFDKKKEEAMKQLSEADRKLEIALARMGEIRKRIDELELERNNQMRFHYLEKEIKRLNAIRISNTIKRYRARINELNKLIEEKSREGEELSKEFDKVRMELEELERERAKIMQEVDRSTKNKAEINTKISNLIVRLEQLKATKNASEQRINVIGNAIPSLIKEKEELKQKIARLEVEIKRIEEEERLLDEKKNNINNNISKLNENLDQLNKELSELNTKENRLNSALRDKEGLYTNIKSRLAEISERLKVLDENINSNTIKLENLSKEVNRLEDNLKQLEGIKDKRDEDLSNIKDDIERLTERKSKLSQYIDEALDVLENAMKITAKYDARLSASKDVNAEEYSIAMLLKDKDPRILGVVKDLIRYDRKYTKAIIAIANEWLNAIVVNTINDALTIIEESKIANLERVKVIPLDIINKFEFDRKGKLSEIVYTDYKKLADFILDAYIVDSSSEARKIAEKGYNAVTLDGEVFTANLSSIKLSQTNKLKDLTKMILLSRSIDDLKDVLSKLDELVTLKKEQLKSIDNRLEESRNKSIEMQTIVNDITAQINTTKEQLLRYKNNIDNLRRKVEEYMTTRKNMVNDLNDLNEKEKMLTEEIEKIKNELNAIDKYVIIKKLDEINSTKSKLSNELDAIEEEKRKIITQLSSSNLSFNNSKKRIDDINKELDRLKKEARDRRSIIINASNELKIVEEELKKARDIEQEMINTSANAVTLLKEYDEKIKIKSEEEKRYNRQLSVIEKDLAISKKEINDLINNETKMQEELTNLGYNELVEKDIEVDIILKELTKEYDSIKNTINQLADKSYKQLIEGYRGMSERRNQLEEERNSIVRFIESIDNEKKKIFMESFEKIDKDIRHIFATMTDNLGSAWLEIEDPDNIFESGLALMIQFPNKPARESTSLSGGEKTIAAITFLLALQSLKPSPYYLFDEVDAHLDAQNTERLLKILLERSKVSQMIVVSLKDMIVANANLVYGVYARNGVSNVIKYRSRVEVTK